MEDSIRIHPSLMTIATAGQLFVEAVAILIYCYMTYFLLIKKVYNRNLTVLLIFFPLPSTVGVVMSNVTGIFSILKITKPWLVFLVNFTQNTGIFAAAIGIRPYFGFSSQTSIFCLGIFIIVYIIEQS
ncbi:hypothetical protein NECAME_03758 [Necator americanus]|uniref:Uncharacterized protein n=1 Tax=Necator americanus TaxID=51031 RepID=W2T2D3_NECAM|nr:hypothetical protein NECAME_03758 [Necator americanus]ETN75376.1 hypothetical protein NECAME_03758 [Necator americanus]